MDSEYLDFYPKNKGIPTKAGSFWTLSINYKILGSVAQRLEIKIILSQEQHSFIFGTQKKIWVSSVDNQVGF